MDPLEKVRKLKEAAERVGKEHDVELKTFAIIPKSDEVPTDVVNLAFLITPTAIETADEAEQRQTDDAFSAMMQGMSLEGFESEAPDNIKNKIADMESELNHGDDTDD